MKARLFLLTLVLAVFANLPAQRFGNIDPSFFMNGRYAFTQPSDMDIMLTFIDHRYWEDEQTFILMVGGNYSKNYQHQGAILCWVKPNSLMAHMGMPAADLHRLYEGVVTPEGKLLVAGYKQIPSGTEARMGRFLEPDLIDRGFGTNGIVLVDNQAGRDDVGGFVIDDSDPTRPMIYLNGATDNGSGITNPVWWKFNNDGTPVTGFGSNGRLVHNDGYSWSGFWHALSVGSALAGVGAAGEIGYFSLMNPATSQWKHFYYPATAQNNHIYDATGAIPWDNTLLLTGNHWNLNTESGSAWVQYFDDVTADRLTSNQAINEAFAQSLTTLASENKCTITGIFKPAVWKVPQIGMLKEGQPEGGYLLAGTIEYESGPEQTFVAAFTRDGALYREFGNNGITVIRMDPGSWPVDMVYSEDGYIYIAMNGGDRYGYLYRLVGYRDLSGIDVDEISVVSMKLYPNPTDGAVTLEIAAPAYEKTLLQVTDVSGRLVYIETLDLHPGQNLIPIGAADWTPGLYSVFLHSEGQVIMKTLIRK